MKQRRLVGPASFALLAALSVGRAEAAYVGDVDGAPLRLEITETSVTSYHWDNRNYINYDDNYAEWLNHLNVVLAWKSWQAGVRFDTAVYGHTPDPSSPELTPADRSQLPYHYRNQALISPGIPSKFYVTYASPHFEATVGDGYVSFGRGLVLSMRKVDELAVDTSLQGAKVVARFAPFTFTGVAGLSNPVRVDEASAATLRDPDPSAVGRNLVTWTRDVIVGARAESKLGTSTLGVHASDVIHDQSIFGGYDWRNAPTGPLPGSPTLNASQVQAAGASLAIPKLSSALPINLFVEWAVQNRLHWDGTAATDKDRGIAAYGSASYSSGVVTTTLEGKHYRGFYPVGIYADTTKFGGFTTAVQYNAPPTVELITQDSLKDNSCTTGGRARVDVKPTKAYAMFASAAYFANWGEQVSTCYQGGGFGLTHAYDAANDTTQARPLRNDIVDGYVGAEYRAQHESSYILATAGARRDTKAQGPAPGEGDFYRETWLQFDALKMLDADWAVEVQGWHRKRYETTNGWYEGEDYLSLKRGSKQAFFLGHEYSSDPSKLKRGSFLSYGSMQHYLNVGAQFRFTDDVQLRLFAGQQRPALKCVAGVCRNFPAFEGAKAEVVVRY